MVVTLKRAIFRILDLGKTIYSNRFLCFHPRKAFYPCLIIGNGSYKTEAIYQSTTPRYSALSNM